MTAPAIIHPKIYISGHRCELTYRKPGGTGQAIAFGEWGITLEDDGTFSRWSGWFATSNLAKLLHGPVCRFVGHALVPDGPRLLLRDHTWRWKSQVFGVVQKEEGGLFSGIGYLVVHDSWVMERGSHG